VTNGQAAALGPRLLAKHFAMEKRSEMLRNAKHAEKRRKATFEKLHPSRVSRAGMAGGGLGRRPRRPALMTMIGMEKRDLARRRQERAGVADGFHVDQDAVGAWNSSPRWSIMSPQLTSEHGAGGDE